MEIPHHFSIFYSLARSIAYQQLAGAAASAILARLEGLFPRKRMTPRKLLAIDDLRLRGAGLSQNKLAALRDLAAKCLDGTVPSKRALARMADDEIIERISQVRGIGRWTVEMMLIFRLGRPTSFPSTTTACARACSASTNCANFHQRRNAPPRPQMGAMVLGCQLVYVAMRRTSRPQAQTQSRCAWRPGCDEEARPRAAPIKKAAKKKTGR